MATIYDVAKMACVSISTVSNYLNNKYVGTARSRAIQEAIEELHYTPNHIARSLKINTSNQVLLILPNLGEKVYSEIAAGVTGCLSDRHYSLTLELTNDQPEKERALLSRCVNSPYAGIILCTCDPGNTEVFLQLQERRPVVFLLRKPDNIEDYSFIGFDNYEIVYRLTSYLLEQNRTNLGIWTGPQTFSCERACLKAFTRAHEKSGVDFRPDYAVALPSTKEIVFRSATRAFADKVFPQFIITSSKLTADAIVEAAYFQNVMINRNLCILSLGEERWYNTEQLRCIISTIRPAQKLGMEAASELLESISSPVVYEKRQRQLKDEFSFTKLEELLGSVGGGIPEQAAFIKARRKIRLLFAQTESSVNALKYLLPHFSEHYNVDVEVKELPVDELMPFYLKLNEEKSDEFDIFHVDCPWLPTLVSSGALLDITDEINGNPTLRQKLIPHIFEALSMQQGRVYGFPMLFCSQLLFYRSDLFRDPLLQNDFENKFHRKLSPPSNWFEFNLVARYFTQAFHPSSPTTYGTVMGTRLPELLMTDIFPRIWSYGGSVFDSGGAVSLYSDEVIQAYKNYVECLEYCDPEHPVLDTTRYIQRFVQGDTAMLIAFSNHASGILDRSVSKVYERTAFQQIPGGISVLGGWDLCVNRHSRNMGVALEMMNWMASSQISIPYTILGGGSTRNSIFTNAELSEMYPWLPLSKQLFQSGRARLIPPERNSRNVAESVVDRILAKIATDSLGHPERVAENVLEADRALRGLFD